jgi:hypothetical protein
MPKPIQFYALVRGRYHHSRGFSLIGVTSEKGRQVYGRDEFDAATHVSDRDVIHRFSPEATLEFCKAAPVRADLESKLHSVGISQARAELSRLEDNQRQAVLAAAKGQRCAVTKTPPPVEVPDVGPPREEPERTTPVAPMARRLGESSDEYNDRLRAMTDAGSQ